MKDFMKVASIFAVGFLTGSLLEYWHMRKAVDANYKLYLEELEKFNNQTEECNRLDLELRQCRLTNWQVAQYASQLKKQLDHFME